MEDEPRIYPKSSAFEALLAKVYLELWELQDDPATYARRVNKFVRVFLPTMFQNKVPDLNEKLTELMDRLDALERAKHETDPLTEEVIDQSSIPAEEAKFADEVWHAVVDVLTDAGFNFPMAAGKPRRLMRP